MAFRIEQTATPSPDDMAAVLDGLVAYNHAAAAMEMTPLAVSFATSMSASSAA